MSPPRVSAVCVVTLHQHTGKVLPRDEPLPHCAPTSGQTGGAVPSLWGGGRLTAEHLVIHPWAPE